MDTDDKPKVDERDTRFLCMARGFDLAGQIVAGIIWLGLAYIGYLAIDSLAGKTTIANILLGYFTSKESDFGLPWILAVVFAIWAILERRLRKRKTESMQSHIRELEQRLDPSRTSSGLLPTGETHPQDENL